MNKSEYFNISEKKKLPLRCPILNVCERKAMSVFYLSYMDMAKSSIYETLKDAKEIPNDFEKIMIPVQGESPTMIKGNSSAYYCNFCPEVSLFDSTHRWSGMGEVACVSASYDKYWGDNNTRCEETKHYSECSEYAYQSYLDRLSKSNKKKRKPISSKLRAKLQQEVKSECPFCKNKEVAYFEVHHIDENPSNNDSINLIMLCRICHSKITEGEIDINRVKVVKNELVNSLY